MLGANYFQGMAAVVPAKNFVMFFMKLTFIIFQQVPSL
jgi:hypothetical protein